MTFIIPPPIKIEFPEQIALSHSISGDRVDVAASEKAINLLRQSLLTGLYPIGCPIPCPMDIPPSDEFFLMKGQAFDGDANPILKSIYGDTLLDMRGKAIVGLQEGEEVLSFVANQVKYHGHPSSYVGSTGLGTKSTNSGGNHRHSVALVSRDYAGSRLPEAGGHNLGRNATTLYGGSHNHSINLGTHAHSLVIKAYGAPRNTIDSHLFNWMVRKG